MVEPREADLHVTRAVDPLDGSQLTGGDVVRPIRRGELHSVAGRITGRAHESPPDLPATRMESVAGRLASAPSIACASRCVHESDR